MPKLNDADKLYLGGAAVDRAYLGANQVWTAPAAPEPVGIVDSANLIERWNAQTVADANPDLTPIPIWTGDNGYEGVAYSDYYTPRIEHNVGGIAAMRFYLDVLHTNQQYVGAEKMSVYVKVWFTNANGANNTMITHDTGPSSTRSMHLKVQNNGIRHVAFSSGGSSGQSAQGPAGIPSGQWGIAHGTRSLQAVRSFWDGVLQDEMVPSSLNIGASCAFAIGARGGANGTEHLDGWIREVRVYEAEHDEATRAAVLAQMNE